MRSKKAIFHANKDARLLRRGEVPLRHAGSVRLASPKARRTQKAILLSSSHNMFARSVRTAFCRTVGVSRPSMRFAVRWYAEAAPAATTAASKVSLTIATPVTTVTTAEVDSVVLPGSEGQFEVRYIFPSVGDISFMLFFSNVVLFCVGARVNLEPSRTR